VAEEQRRATAEAAARQAEEQRRKEVEKARRQEELAMVARQRDREARKAEAEQQRRRREEERSRRELMAREQQRLEQERKAIFAKALEEYIGAIQSSVVRNWRRPTGVPPRLNCTVNVVQANNGKVLRVEITQSSGNVAFDRSVEQAVLAASPLPPPRHKAVFDREIIFLFNPRS
jgi:colicin import membrane protein